MLQPTRLMMAAVFATLAAAGCVDNYGVLAISGAVKADDQCDSTAAVSVLTQGVLDVDVVRDRFGNPPGYKLFPVIENNLVPVGQNNAPEPNVVYLQGAHVKLTVPEGWALSGGGCDGSSFDVLASLSIPPSEYRSVELEVIQPCQAAEMRAALSEGQYGFVQVDVQVYGKDDAKSDTFTFPVKVCRGCLRTGVPVPYSACDYPAVCQCSEITTDNPAKGWACNPGQDSGPVLCCQESDGITLACPAPDGKPAPSQ